MRRDGAIMVTMAIATIAVFWRVAGYEFVNYDDYAYVTLNPFVQQGLTWEAVGWAFGQLHGQATYWHPVTWLSHMLDCQLFGLNPAGHHLGNVFFHALNTVLLFVLLKRMTGRRGSSAVVAALFALHPLQVDSVAWVAERKNVLSTLFWILALLAYGRYAARPGWTRYALVFVLMALGLMAKPTLVTLPCVMLLLDFWPLRRWPLFQPALAVGAEAIAPTAIPNQKSRSLKSIGWLIAEKLPFLALSVASSVITIQGHKALGALLATEQLPMLDRLANAVVAYAVYLRKLVWPVDLSVFYMHPGKWPTGTIVGSGVLLLAVTTVALLQARRRPYLLVGWLWFLGTLVPAIGVVQANTQAFADRFVYVPLIGLFVMVVWTVADWTAPLKQRLKVQVALTGLALVGCVATTSLQLQYWRNSVTLLRRAVQVAGGNYLAHMMLGNALFERGQFDLALGEYLEALRLRRDYPDAWQRAGVALQQLGRSVEAIPYFSGAIQVAPGWPEARRGLALALVSQGRMAEARMVYQSLAPLLPDTAEGHTQLAEMLAEGQQPAEAVRHYREALRLNPDYLPALNNLAWLRATCALAEWRDGREAISLAERACQLSRRRVPHFLGALAAAYAEAGRFNEAVQTIQEAQAIARASGTASLLPLQARMRTQFEAGKPFHEGAR